MNEQEVRRANGYVSFVDLFKVSELEQALQEHKGTDDYDAVFRYYFGCISVLDFPRMRTPLGLLLQALKSFTQPSGRRRRSAEVKVLAEPGAGPSATLTDILERVETFQTRLSHSVEELTVAAIEVPKNLHFVWLGGGIGDIQRDYITLWKQVMAGEGHSIKLWYDSDALMAYETNRIIVEAAKAEAMLKGGSSSKTAIELGDKYEERAIVLKQQMSAHITQAVERGEKADDARIDLLVRGYGQNEADLNALKAKNNKSISALGEGGVELRDLANNGAPLQLQSVYEREIRLRGNLAAASDVVRVEALFTEGGRYADVDNLPPLLDVLDEVDISQFGSDARLGVLQLMLDHNPEWIPGRQALRSKYTDYFKEIPEAHRSNLERFAKSRPALNRVFRPSAEGLVRPNGLRAVAEQSSLNNAFLMAHAGSAMLSAVIERFRFNYEIVDATARLAMERKIALIDTEAMSGLALEVVENRVGPLVALPPEEELSLGFLVEAAAAYYSDGIRPQSEVTIYLTGPAAMRDAIAAYAKTYFTPMAAQAWRADVAIAATATVNRATEEELDHSWKENESDTAQWLIKEKQRWEKDNFKARYVGNMDQLLDNQTLHFDHGWPVIEGRHVLSTERLQSLAQWLGEPFLQAMSEQITGEVIFDKSLLLDFDERQSIFAQEVEVPPTSVVVEAARVFPLDELLHRISRGMLKVEQLNPLQRLLIGSLLGARGMDDRSFGAINAGLENLANTVSELGVSHRYGAIERELFKQNHPAFVAGMAGASAPSIALSETSIELKKQALERSLTLEQWGRQVARIQQVAKLEYRDRVSERMTDVLESFDRGSFKLVPQDLLLQGSGDRIAGRCYPLALAMAAAIGKGGDAANILRERFYLAVMEPDASDSNAFVSIIEELRDTDVHDIGAAVILSDLAQVITKLEEKTGTRTLMLNSDNHSMLVAKTSDGRRSTYHFYDPNFGVFEFDTAGAFGEALEHFFIGQEMARHYAAYGEATRPTFDLIELDAALLNERVLPSGARVSSLSAPGTLPEQTAPRVRQRLASARGQSLVNNVVLGSSLLELDAHWWGGQIAQATRQLQEQHRLTSSAVVLFETLEITPQGAYKISLVDPASPQTIERVTTDDHRFLRIKNFLTETFRSLATRPRGPINAPDPTDAGSVHTLNAGFTIQALMNSLRHQERASSGGDKALTTAIRLHAYVNYAQLAHGNVVDVIGVVTLVRQALDDEKLIARTSVPLVQKALGHVANEGVATVLGMVNVGFDIYQLNQATNDIEKAQFGTQLAFDSASAVLGIAGLGAALAGAGTVAAVLGGAGVILGGLAVGVTALAEGFASIAEEVKEVGLFFEGVEKAYQQGGYHLDTASNAWVAHPLLVFADLDLRASRVRFDSPKLFPLRDHFGVPDFDVDYDRAVDIRQGLELPDSAPFAPQPGQTIVLPCTPKTWYGYEYKALPFVTLRHAGGFDTARRLEKKNEQGQWQFLFSFYSFPGEYVVNKLNPVYKPTVFDVRLDNVERSLVVPALPKVWHNMITYRIEGAGAQCSVLLNPGVSLELDAPGHTAMRWMLLAPWLNEADVRVEQSASLISGTLNVKFIGRGVHDVLLKLAGNKIVRVDLAARQLEVVEESADPALGEQALLDHFKSLAREHRLVMPYTPVHEFVVPFEKPDEPRKVAAYYDSAQDRFLYIREPSVLLADEAVLGAVVEGSAFFYHPESFDVWQVDATTGTLVRRYRLLVGDGLAIVGCEAMADGSIQVVQQLTRKEGEPDELTYRIRDQAVLLNSITRGQDPALQAVLDADTLTDWKQVLGHFVLPGESANTVDWRPGALVSICWQIDATWRDLVWVRDGDGLIIRAPARRHRTRGWADSVKALADLLLIAPAGAEGEVFVTYDKPEQRLIRLQKSMVNGRVQWTFRDVGPQGLKNVAAVGQDYLVLTDSGLFFNMTPDGNLRLGGLTETWFKDRTQWWSALATVATDYPVSSFAILGLASFKGDTGLCAWYLDDRLLLSDPGHGKEVRLLSITPDNQAVWLFDLSTGKIFRQRFIDPDRLSGAFAQGVRLLVAEALPSAQQEWAPWTFADVAVAGAGLRATTSEGLEVDLQHNEQPRITGVGSHWVAALEGELSEGLARMANEHRCAEFVSVKDPDYLQWYVVRTARLIRIPKATIAAQYTLVGTRQQTSVMLHEHGDGFLHTYPQNTKVGPLDYIQRNAEVLVIEGPKMSADLLPLIADDVRILVLKMGQGATTSRLTRAAWLKLESVIVDCRYPLEQPPSIPGKVILDALVTDQWWVSLVDEHLVMNDSSSGHSLIFRGVYSSDVTLRGDVFLALSGYRSCAVSQIVAELMRQKGTSVSATLKELMSHDQVEVMAEPSF
ncbi:TcdA/TcdB pore-forming domain-containing protein [Pseudomonas arsenicoxydans]|nr:TcdA/TcdB pore-forming domain-containing protein [Pseudomonas arsenicoxydans]